MIIKKKKKANTIVKLRTFISKMSALHYDIICQFQVLQCYLNNK